MQLLTIPTARACSVYPFSASILVFPAQHRPRGVGDFGGQQPRRVLGHGRQRGIRDDRAAGGGDRRRCFRGARVEDGHHREHLGAEGVPGMYGFTDVLRMVFFFSFETFFGPRD